MSSDLNFILGVIRDQWQVFNEGMARPDLHTRRTTLKNHMEKDRAGMLVRRPLR